MEQILKFQGNSKYFSALVKKEKEIFIYLAFIDDKATKLSIDSKTDNRINDDGSLSFWQSHKLQLEMTFKKKEETHFVYVCILSNDIKEYDGMIKLLEVLYPDDTE